MFTVRMVTHAASELHGTTYPTKRGRLALVFFQHNGSQAFDHGYTKIPSDLNPRKCKKLTPVDKDREIQRQLHLKK